MTCNVLKCIYTAWCLNECTLISLKFILSLWGKLKVSFSLLECIELLFRLTYCAIKPPTFQSCLAPTCYWLIILTYRSSWLMAITIPVWLSFCGLHSWVLHPHHSCPSLNHVTEHCLYVYVSRADCLDLDSLCGSLSSEETDSFSLGSH